MHPSCQCYHQPTAAPQSAVPSPGTAPPVPPALCAPTPSAPPRTSFVRPRPSSAPPLCVTPLHAAMDKECDPRHAIKAIHSNMLQLEWRIISSIKSSILFGELSLLQFVLTGHEKLHRNGIQSSTVRSYPFYPLFHTAFLALYAPLTAPNAHLADKNDPGN